MWGGGGGGGRKEAAAAFNILLGSSLRSGLALLLLSLSEAPVSLAVSRASLSESVLEPRRRLLLGITSKSELSLRVSLSSRRRNEAAEPRGRSDRGRGSL